MDYFGHQMITRNLIVSFMDWFSKIKIEKYGSITVSGEDAFVSRKIIPVPIQWAAREKWVEILRSSSARKAMDPAIREKNPVEMQWILPRISCNLIGIDYDSTRKLPKTQQIGQFITQSIDDSRSNIYSPVPYNLQLEIVSIARHLDDNFQIMEQILPFFGPSMSLNVFLYPDRDSESIPVILNNVSQDIPIDIGENDERFYTTTYTFTLKANYFPLRRDIGYITTIDTNLVTDITINNINIKWLEDQQKIQTRFNEYQATTDIPNPFLKL